MLNLSAAKITNTTGVLQGTNDPVPLYVVEGDEKTWVSNGAVETDNVEFQTPRNYTEDDDSGACREYTIFHW